MVGKINFLSYGIVLISSIAVLTDLFLGKIYNWLTLSGVLLGLISSSYFLGWEGLLQSCLGIGLAFLAFSWMYGFGWLGAGDVKFLMALGAWGGWHYAAEVALLSVLYGGIMAVFLLLIRGRLIVFIKKMYFFLLSIFVKELELYFPPVDQSLRMPFGIAMGIAAVTNLWMHPLSRLGVDLWWS